MTTYNPSIDAQVFGGNVMYAADHNELAYMMTRTYTKGTSEDRSATTTYSNDAELSNIPLEVGSFEIVVHLFWTQLISNTQKIKVQWGFTGTWSTVTRFLIGAGSAQTGAPNAVTEVQLGGANSDTGDAIYDQALGSSFGYIEEKANVTVTVAGAFAVKWVRRLTV